MFQHAATSLHPAQLQAEIAWESCKEGTQPVSAATRYQRFLEQELGQLLQAQAPGLKGTSQLPERQANRQSGSMQGEGRTGTFQLPDKQLNRQTSATKRQTNGPAPGSSPAANGLHWLQAEGQIFLHDEQSRCHKGGCDRHSHASNQHFSQPEHRHLLQSIGDRRRAATTALAANSALPSEVKMSELTAYMSGGLVNTQKRAQTEAKPARSQRSVNQRLSQHDEEDSASTLESQAREQRWQHGYKVDFQPASMGMTPLAGDKGGPMQHSGVACRDDGELKQPQLTRQVLSHMRVVSPQRRQLLLQARFALFDSDSSSSDEEDGSVQEVS